MPAPSKDQAVLSATDLALTYGNQVIFEGATVAIYQGEKVGLVGRNGSGKSSFLRIVAGEDQPDGGTVTTKRDLTVGYLSQEFTLREEATVLENVRDGARVALDLVERYEGEADLSPDEMERVLSKIETLDAWNVEMRIETVMRELGAPPPDQVVSTLSGGEKRRVALCRALVANPELLVLDEPTNHLDAESIAWLETFLQETRATVLFVTHDRYFLEHIATRIAELANGRFFAHDGNYDDFLEAKAARQESEVASEAKRQTFLRREIDWVRAGVKARGTKQRSRIDNFYAVKAQKAPEKELDMELVVPPAPALGNIVVDLENVAAEIGGHTLFEHFSLSCAPGQCTGVVGRNGAGKTTLLRIMMGQLEPAAGRVAIGKRTLFNYVDQTRLELDEDKSVLDEVSGDQDFVQFGAERISVRGYLRRFLFTDERINDRVGNLSGGEKNRVLLAKILRRGGNFLVLDEPTNDLDLQTLRVLEETIINFSGCTVVVSHDRYFLDRVCDRIIAFEGSGRVIVHEGNYSYYVQKRREREQARAARATAAKAAAGPAQAPKPTQRTRKFTNREQQELDAMEETILAEEERAGELEGRLSDGDFYKENAAAVTEIHAELEALRTKIERLYARWEELEALRTP
ncbi:energy-dependent translational throttle protein EttA [soil metagenome]